MRFAYSTKPCDVFPGSCAATRAFAHCYCLLSLKMQTNERLKSNIAFADIKFSLSPVYLANVTTLR